MENEFQKQKRKQRDKEILELYPRFTMRKIADMYNLSYERVRQILEKQAVDK